MRAARLVYLVALLIASLTLGPTLPAAAQTPAFAAPGFEAVWTRADRPVATGAVSRTWLWGPAPLTAAMQEPYAQSPGGQRLVQYFDKSRMELTNPADPQAVTNGLLSKELITGRLQTGDAAFEERAPAEMPVAGDPDDATGPLYATFRALLSVERKNSGEVLMETLSRDGSRATRAELSRYQVTGAYVVPETQHTIASPFWELLQTTGPVAVADRLETAPLFEPTFFATGLPITEAYWTRVKVAGTVQDVLIQAFERRVLTYTPANPAGFQVEMGNVGRHYHAWRYQGAGVPPPPKTSAACALLLQLSDLPAGYRVQEEQCPQNQPTGTRTFQDPARMTTGFPFVASAVMLAASAEEARASYNELVAELKKQPKSTTKSLRGVGEQAVVFAQDLSAEGTPLRLIAVAFRRGTAVGIVVGVALPNAGDQGQVVEWAKIMDGRIASRPG